jgi:hypothetical protein
MTVYVAYAHAHVQRLVLVVRMATVLEVYATEEQRSVVLFCGQKDTMQRIFINKCFLFTVGSVCRVKRSTTGSRKSLRDVRKSQMIPNQVWKWLRQQSKKLLCCVFRCTGKEMGQIYQCWRRMSRNTCFFKFEYNMFYVLYPFVSCLLTLPRIIVIIIVFTMYVYMFLSGAIIINTVYCCLYYINCVFCPFVSTRLFCFFFGCYLIYNRHV